MYFSRGARSLGWFLTLPELVKKKKKGVGGLMSMDSCQISGHSLARSHYFLHNTYHYLKLSYIFVYSFIISLPPLEPKVHGGPCLFCSPLCCQHLEQDVAQSRCSVLIGQING